MPELLTPQYDDDAPASPRRRTPGGRRGAGERERGTLSPWSILLAAAVVVAVVMGQWLILVAVLGLAFLIVVHEFGHFLAAKLFHMRVEKFYVGFPPAAVRHTWGETEYGIGLIPLGGFCKISGMTPEEPVDDDAVDRLVAEVRRGDVHGTYTVAEYDAALKRTASRLERLVEKDVPETSPDVRAVRRRQQLLQARREALLAHGEQGDPVYYRKPIWQRNLAIFAGPLMNFLIAPLILILFFGIQGTTTLTLTISKVLPNTPAARAGLKAGDRLTGADGARFATWDDATAYFTARPDKTVHLTYRPGATGAERTVTVRLTKLKGYGFLGVEAGQQSKRLGPTQAVTSGSRLFAEVVTGTFKGFWRLVTKGGAAGDSGAVGPIGIIEFSRQAIENRIYPVLLAIISVNLGILNLIPILPFDGGHIAVNLIEKVRRRRMGARALGWIVAVGVTLLALLFIFVTYNDVRRIFGG